MYKFPFRFLILVLLMNGSELQAQPSVLHNQLKSIISTGEKDGLMESPKLVLNKSISPDVLKPAPPDTPLFLRQIKTILEAAGSGIARHKDKLVYTSDEGIKNYSCTLKLEGFKTYVTDDEGAMTFSAEADNYKLSAINAKKFIDKKQREAAGILGYTTTFTALKNGNIYNADEVTKFDKPGNLLFIRVYKNWFDRGYRIEIEEIVME